MALKGSEQGGERQNSSVSVSLPLADLHSLYLAHARLKEIADCGQFVDPSELGPMVDLIGDILPPPEMITGLYLYMRKGHNGSTSRYRTSWNINPA